MPNPEGSTAPDWMRLAGGDLESARVLAGREPPLVEQALTLSQQAGEKALKALIAAAEGTTPPIGHDLTTLLDHACRHVPSLESLSDDAARLTRYAVAPRYPEVGVTYTADEAASAIAAAERILGAAREALK